MVVIVHGGYCPCALKIISKTALSFLKCAKYLLCAKHHDACWLYGPMDAKTLMCAK